MKKMFVLLSILALTACGVSDVDRQREDAYSNMKNKMVEYYDEYYNNMKASLDEDLREKDLMITLKNLQTANFDLSTFKNFDTGELCDLEKTNAIIDQTPDKVTNPDDEYIITIYYKCGDYEKLNPILTQEQ